MATIVFDGDDTLWYVEWKYSQAYADFYSYLYKTLEHLVPNIHFVHNVLSAVEAENSKTWGINRGRVAESMVQTYKKICEAVQARTGENPYKLSYENTIRKIGDQPFDVIQHHWIDGARETLTVLSGRGHDLCLLTKYDRQLWPEKARVLGVHEYIDPANILTVKGRKVSADFVEAAKWSRKKNDYVAVGNSEGDLVPSEELPNWRGFYIPLASSVPLEKDSRPTEVSFDPIPINHPKITTLKEIWELTHHL